MNIWIPITAAALGICSHYDHILTRRHEEEQHFCFSLKGADYSQHMNFEPLDIKRDQKRIAATVLPWTMLSHSATLISTSLTLIFSNFFVVGRAKFIIDYWVIRDHHPSYGPKI